MIDLGRHGLRHVLLVGRPDPGRAEARGKVRRIRIDHARDALDLLRSISGDRSNMMLLRRLLAEEIGTARAFDRGDREVLEQLAFRLANGQLTATLVEPPEPDFALGVPPPPEVAPGEAPEQEPRNSPIVPPEYIILARRESNETIDDTRRLDAKIGNLSFLGWSREKPPSKVADEYPSVAEAERMSVDRAAFNLEAAIQRGRYVGYDKARAPSSVADEYTKTAVATHGRATGHAARFADRMDALRFERHDPNRHRSSIADEYPEVAAAEVKHTKAVLLGLDESVGRLRHEPTIQHRASSVLGEELRSIAKTEGRGASSAILVASRDIDALRWQKKDDEPRPASAIAGEYSSVALAQSAPVKRALTAFVASVAKTAAATPLAEAERASEIGEACRTMSADQAERAASVVARLSAELDAIRFTDFRARST